MRIRRGGVQEGRQRDPEHRRQREEFGAGFPVELDGGGPADVRGAALRLGHLVAALAPKGAALGEAGGAAEPGGVCGGRRNEMGKQKG